MNLRFAPDKISRFCGFVRGELLVVLLVCVRLFVCPLSAGDLRLAVGFCKFVGFG